MEGTAELLGTHRFDDRYERLTLRTMPPSRDEVPMLGRIKLIDDALADKRVLDLPAVMEIDNRKQLGNEAYAWCWAAAKFLDSHPRYRDRFRELRDNVRDRDFNERLPPARIADDWADLQAEWQAFIATLDHGYDFERMAIDFEPRPAARRDGRALSTIAADRGWQSSGVRLEAGKSYRVTATGRYEIANDGRAVAVRAGRRDDRVPRRPAARHAARRDRRPHAATRRSPIHSTSASSTTIKPTASGTLYLRVNDSPGQTRRQSRHADCHDRSRSCSTLAVRTG